MDSFSYSSTAEAKNLMNLLNITEELLFSIPLNADLVEKYMVLRETGLKKVGLSGSNAHLWEIQRLAHKELDHKHSSQERQIKEISENLDLYKKSYKELYDVSLEITEFLYECTGKSMEFARKSKENLQLSLLSNHAVMNTEVVKEFTAGKKMLKDFLQKEKEKSEEILGENRKLQWEIEENEKKIERIEEEYRIRCEKTVIEQRRIASKELEESKSVLKLQDAKYSKEIEEIRENYEKQLRFLEDEKNYILENMTSSIKTSHKQELKELEQSFRVKENELLEELDNITNTDPPVLQSLRETIEALQVKVQDLREVLRAVTERTNSLYGKYAYKEDNLNEFLSRKEEISNISENKAWQQYSEVLTQLDFMALSFKKISSDNEWLVEQIDELTKENEINRELELNRECEMIQKSYFLNDEKNIEKECYDEVLNTLTANEVVIKDFQDARSKLLKQFADAKRPL